MSIKESVSKITSLRLTPKLIMFFLIIGILPAAIIGYLALENAQTALSKQAFNQLEAVRGIKTAQIGQFFAERQGDIGVLTETVSTLRTEAFTKLEAIQAIKRNQISQYFKRISINLAILAYNPTTISAVREFEDAFSAEGGRVGGLQWTAVNDRFGHLFAKLLEEDGYYDVFLIAADGDVVYSAEKESDLGQNLLTGSLSDTSFARAFRDSENMKVGFGDFQPYAPSGDQPASFLATSIVDENGNRIGAVAVQIPENQINEIMQERAGLGVTGETYLVGPDKLMRSDSYLDPKNHSVKASFANPETGAVDTTASQVALSGKSGEDLIIDYNGNPVLSVYSPLDVFGVRWAIIAEIDAAEAFVPVDAEGRDFYSKYVEMYGYYDLFLLNPDGYVFYSAAKEADYQTNMVDGKYASSNLGKLVRQVRRTKSFGLADFAPYAPSNGEPAAFIAQPVMHQGGVEIIVALQLSLDAINTIMQQREGMGETGETYLVGSDNLMRSDSYLDPKNHSVKASFANPSMGSVETVTARKALAGESGAIITLDYNGNSVLSAYAPVTIGDTTWAILTEIDEAEAFASIVALQWLMFIIGAVAIAAIAVIGFLLARSIANPMVEMTDVMGKLAGGDKTVEIPAQERTDEIGEMAGAVQVFKENAIEMDRMAEEQKAAEKRAEEEKKRAMNEMADGFESSVKGIVDAVAGGAAEMQSTAESMASTAEETSRQSQAAAAASEQASTNVQTVSAAAEEMATSVNEIARQV
ncbi:MAG: methyl-accepting chemotaxis protein, partial [Candidatus Hydrogenedentes bacterium]|nr:methyl-accepting chemotaxis protein [Candidatus Hydrogenedentota bacterium]